MSFMYNQSYIQSDTNPLKKVISPFVDSAGVTHVYFKIKYELDRSNRRVIVLETC